MKSQRQAKILEIIATKNIETQEQLLAELQKEGFRGTQATISRDIKELRIVKPRSKFIRQFRNIRRLRACNVVAAAQPSVLHILNRSLNRDRCAKDRRQRKRQRSQSNFLSLVFHLLSPFSLFIV